MLTIPVSLSLPTWPVAPLLCRVFATLVSVRHSIKTQPKTLALEVRSNRNVLIPLTSSPLALPDSPRVAFDPLLVHVPQPITSFKSLFFWLCEGLEMAGSQFTALCKAKPLREHEESDDKIGSDADNGTFASLFLFFISANTEQGVHSYKFLPPSKRYPDRLTPLAPPRNFGAVIPGQIYRGSFPIPENFSFLKSLKLKTILYA